QHPHSTLLAYTTLFRSWPAAHPGAPPEVLRPQQYIRSQVFLRNHRIAPRSSLVRCTRSVLGWDLDSSRLFLEGCAGLTRRADRKIGRAHVCTPVTFRSH